MNHLITGPMFAGKSKYLIKYLNCILYEKTNAKILFIYPESSFRGYFCRDKDVTLDKRIEIISEESLIQNRTFNSILDYISDYEAVGFDEYCLMKNTDLFLDIIKVSKNDFYISSLDMDFERKKWDSVTKLLDCSLIDIHTSLTGKCECGKKGIYSKRLSNTKGRVVIGDNIYKCVCKECYEKY